MLKFIILYEEKIPCTVKDLLNEMVAIAPNYCPDWTAKWFLTVVCLFCVRKNTHMAYYVQSKSLNEHMKWRSHHDEQPL